MGQLLSIDDLGMLGVNYDLAPHEVPPNAFTYVENARMTPAGILSLFAYSKDMAFTPVTGAYSVGYLDHNGTRYWISGNDAKVTSHNGSSATDRLTGQDATKRDRWQLFYFQGNLIANNSKGTNYPGFWKLSDNTTGSISDIATFFLKGKFITKYKNFLVLLDTTENGARYQNRVQWNHPEEAPNIGSWDYTDDVLDAGYVDLTETGGACLCAEALGDALIIYKPDSCYSMTYTGSEQIFRFSNISQSFGALNRFSVTQYPGGHLVLTTNDVVIHDGSGRFKSVVTDKIRTEIFNRITPASADYAFVQIHPAWDEIWICLPALVANGSHYDCDIAYVWNWNTGAIAPRSLPNVSSATIGLPLKAGTSTTSDAYNTVSTTYVTDPLVWDISANNTLDAKSLVMASSGLTTFALMDNWDADVDMPELYLERTSLAITGKKSTGQFKEDTTIRKLLTEAFPRIELVGQVENVELRFGGQEFLNAPVHWTEVYNFSRTELFPYVNDVDETSHPDLGNCLKVSPIINTPLLAYSIRIKFASGAYCGARITSIDLEISPAGKAT